MAITSIFRPYGTRNRILIKSNAVLQENLIIIPRCAIIACTDEHGDSTAVGYDRKRKISFCNISKSIFTATRHDDIIAHRPR
jgi:hypothetical protein